MHLSLREECKGADCYSLSRHDQVSFGVFKVTNSASRNKQEPVTDRRTEGRREKSMHSLRNNENGS